MNNLNHALGTAQALADMNSSTRPVGRPDSVTAHCVEVGLVVNEMLGAAAALAYLARHAVSAKIAQRVLSEGGRRRSSDILH